MTVPRNPQGGGNSPGTLKTIGTDAVDPLFTVRPTEGVADEERLDLRMTDNPSSILPPDDSEWKQVKRKKKPLTKKAASSNSAPLSEGGRSLKLKDFVLRRVRAAPASRKFAGASATSSKAGQVPSILVKGKATASHLSLPHYSNEIVNPSFQEETEDEDLLSVDYFPPEGPCSTTSVAIMQDKLLLLCPDPPPIADPPPTVGRIKGSRKR